MAFPWWPLVGPLQGGAASRRPGCLPELHCSWDKPPVKAPVSGAGGPLTAGTGWWSATGKSFGMLAVGRRRPLHLWRKEEWVTLLPSWHFCTAASVGQQYLTRPKIPKSWQIYQIQNFSNWGLAAGGVRPPVGNAVAAVSVGQLLPPTQLQLSFSQILLLWNYSTINLSEK